MINFNTEKVIHLTRLNVYSLDDNFLTFQPFLENSGIHCCTLSETWLHEAQTSNMYHIHGYQLIRSDRTTSITNGKQNVKKGGGLACYVSNTIKYRIRILS